jgi:hypothetical protein
MAQGNKAAAAERVTFENAHSSRLLEQGIGAPTGSRAKLMGAGSDPSPAIANPAPVNPAPQPSKVDVENEIDANEDFDADEE